jgi:glycosyltransferase involved in cell wall biosynthesis
MRVGILSCPRLVQHEGGMQLQVREAIGALNKLSSNLSAELVNPARGRLDEYHVLHVFSANNGNYRVLEAAAELGVGLVLSPMLSANWGRGNGFRARLADRLAGKLTTWNVQTNYVQTKRALQLADMVIALGEAERDAIMASFLTCPAKIHVLAGGVDRHFFTAKAEVFRHRSGIVGPFVLCAGAISPEHHQIGLMGALAGTGLPLVLIGKVARDQQHYLQRLLDAPWVSWLGELKHDDPLLASAFNAATVVVLPEQPEVLPLAVLEALAAGTAVVLRDDSALVLDGAEFALKKVAWRDPAALRETMLALTLNPPDDQAVRALVEQYTWQRVAAQMAACYAALRSTRAAACHS